MNQRLLIWFRRFQPKYGQKFRFHTALAEACSGLAYPVTIQDSSYRTTLIGSFFGKGWFILPVAFIAFITGLLAVMLLSQTFFAEKFSFLALGIGIAFLLMVVIFIVIQLIRRYGYKSYRGRDAGLRLISELKSIKAGRSGYVMGVDVIHCDDDIWQNVVLAALTMADIVIVDISEITENLAWELSQTLKSLTMDRVILVCDEKAGHSTALLKELNRLFSGISPDLDIEKIKGEIVTYPSERAGIGPRRRKQVVEVVKRLRFEIADHLLHD